MLSSFFIETKEIYKVICSVVSLWGGRWEGLWFFLSVIYLPSLFLAFLLFFFVLHCLCALSCQPLCFPRSLSVTRRQCVYQCLYRPMASCFSNPGATHTQCRSLCLTAVKLRWLRNTNPTRMSTGRARGAVNGAGGMRRKTLPKAVYQ